MQQTKDEIGVQSVELPNGLSEPAEGSGRRDAAGAACPKCGGELLGRNAYSSVTVVWSFCEKCGYGRLEVNE